MKPRVLFKIKNGKELNNYMEKFSEASYENFIYGTDPELKEIKGFNAWFRSANRKGLYIFETERLSNQGTKVNIFQPNGKKINNLNFSSYNYLGYGFCLAVKAAAKRAIDRYGTGTASSPALGGRLRIHKELEEKLLNFLGLGKEYGVSLFTTGYGANFGTVSAFMHPGTYVILDAAAHMSLLEGARLSGATIRLFKHNDMHDLERILFSLKDKKKRKLICSEGVYSSTGDRGKLKQIISLAKKYNALTLVDEAHSLMIAGKHGRGVAEEQGVLDQIDFIIVTFSKAFCCLGGALIARKEIATYIDLYGRCRIFSAAIPPSIAGGIIKVIELSRQPDGCRRRARLIKNAAYLRSLLVGKVDTFESDSWILPIFYGDEKITPLLSAYLQKKGLDAGCMFFPAVPQNKARIRLFISSGHTKKQLNQASKIIINAAKKFGFLSR